jgi:hypothetical protein
MLILDTFNILHATGKVGLGRLDPGRLRELICFSRWRSERVVMVIDGPGPRGGHGRRTLKQAVDIDAAALDSDISEVFAASGGGRADADAVIEALLEREEHFGRARQAVVVSSDKRVRAAAVGARARAISSEDFLRQLAEDVAKSHARAADQTGGRPEFAQDSGMDAGRTAYWLREFGLAPDPRGRAGDHAEASTGADDAAINRPLKDVGSGDRRSRLAGEDSRPEINPDDVDMGEILRSQGLGTPPRREDEDEDDRRTPRRRSR